MNSTGCSRIEENLDLLATGRASPEERYFAEAHLRTCEGCRTLLSAACGELDLPAGGHEDLTRSIIEMTSGPACERAMQSMCESLDGMLEPAQVEILQLHVGHCPGCGRFAAALQLLHEVLPEMAEVDPGPDFAAEVIGVARRSRRVRMRRFHPAFLWNRLIRRPLFTWEAAYAGTLAVALLFLNPWLPLQDYPARAISALEVSIPSGLSSLASARVIPEASEIAGTATHISGAVAAGASSARTSLSRWSDRAENYLRETALPAARTFLENARGGGARLFSGGRAR
jgi:hypothetical protein